MVKKNGVALLLAIIAAGVISIGASMVLLKVEREAKTERIHDYNFILESYRTAISHFQKKYNRLPDKLQDLIDNEKGVLFIRRLYPDPFTKSPFATRRNMTGEIEDVYSEVAARISQEF